MSSEKTSARRAGQFEPDWKIGTYEWWPAEDRLVWSPELIGLYGLDSAPATEQAFLELLHPDDRVRVEAETTAFLEGTAAGYSHGFRIVRPDGAVRAMLDRAAIERDGAGNVRVVRGMNVDVTGENAAGLLPAGQDSPPAGADGLLPGREGHLHRVVQAALAIVFEWDIRADRVSRLLSIDSVLPRTVGQPDSFDRVVQAVHPEDRAGFRAAVEAALASETGEYRSVHRVLGPDGAVRWLAESGCVERDETGAPRRLLGTSHDITAQKRAEEDRAETEALLNSLFDGASVGLGVWDREFRFLRVNDALARINGLPPEAHIGRRPDEILPGLARLPDIYSNWRNIIETGEAWRGVEIRGETPAEPGRMRSWSEEFFPLRMDGRTIGIVGVVQETTRQTVAEERERASEDRYRALFEAIDEGFCVVELCLDGPDGRTDYRVVEANPAFYEQTGFSEEILGRWLRAEAPDLEEHWYEIYGRVARTGAPERFEQHSAMLGRWFDVYAFRIDAPKDRRVAILFNDISERKRYEERVQMLMREVNHRSKNMLGLVQAIARQTAATGAEDFAERFGKRVRALAAAQDVLVHNDWRTVPLADLVQSQLSHFSDLIGERIEIGGPPLSLTPDAAQAIGMALHELATNAAKYGALSNDAGRVSVSWSADPVPSAEARFALAWKERDGPEVTAPETRGFGTRVTVDMVETSTGGEVSVDYARQGLSWRLSCPAEDVLGAAVGAGAAGPGEARP